MAIDKLDIPLLTRHAEQIHYMCIQAKDAKNGNMTENVLKTL